ncbi:MAG: hypothetical protein HY762_03070 [Planctomycetes bacterium]|nr:hypothetical protein [Planctomycetota bacterium]
MITETLGRYKGSLSQTARHLKIGRTTLYCKMKQFGIHKKIATTDEHG